MDFSRCFWGIGIVQFVGVGCVATLRAPRTHPPTTVKLQIKTPTKIQTQSLPMTATGTFRTKMPNKTPFDSTEIQIEREDS